MNKKTTTLTTEQYREIITTMKEGFCGCRPNERIATALVLEGNLGLRISDILRLRLCDIVQDGGRYRLEIITEGEIGAAYVNDEAALSFRMCDLKERNTAIFAFGKAKMENILVKEE